MDATQPLDCATFDAAPSVLSKSPGAYASEWDKVCRRTSPNFRSVTMKCWIIT